MHWLKGSMILFLGIPIPGRDTRLRKGLVGVASIIQVHHPLRPVADLDIIRV